MCVELKRFQVFVEAVFYVGKGKKNRIFDHLKEARRCTESPPTEVSAFCIQIESKLIHNELP